MAINVILLISMVLAALWAVMATRLLRAAIGLALTSVILTIIMFRLNSPLAAVFELSVCAGLITVIFISTISITQSLTEREFLEHRKSRLKRFWYLPVFILISIIFIIVYFWRGVGQNIPIVKIEDDIRSILWNNRQLDLLGQVIILLAGAVGVITFFKRARQND